MSKRPPILTPEQAAAQLRDTLDRVRDSDRPDWLCVWGQDQTDLLEAAANAIDAICAERDALVRALQTPCPRCHDTHTQAAEKLALERERHFPKGPLV